MSSVFIVGDGPLAFEMVSLVESAGHEVEARLVYQERDLSDDELEFQPWDDDEGPPDDDYDILIEAVVGVRHYKPHVINLLGLEFSADTLLLTAVLNASCGETQSGMTRPEMAVGWAALPPLAEHDVVEVVPGMRSDVWAREAAREFLESLGKEVIEVGDTVGGVLPRVVANLVNEASYALMEGVAVAEDIDTAMRKGTSYPYGPLRWGDLVGLDQVLGILTALGEAYGTDMYRPSPLLAQLVQAGHWGQRTGRGFYKYT